MKKNHKKWNYYNGIFQPITRQDAQALSRYVLVISYKKHSKIKWDVLATGCFYN